MIVWLASYPRSGNTYFQILLRRLHGFQSHSVYAAAESQRSLHPNKGWLDEMLGPDGLKWSLDALRADPGKHFVKTHDLPLADRFPAIALVRDGRDALVSYAHFVLKTEKHIDRPSREEFERTLEQLIRGENFGGWSRNVNAWADRVGDDRIIRYEDLIRDPVGIVAEVVQRCAVSSLPAAGTFPTFEEMHSVVPWFFRRGTPGAWKDEMPLRLQMLFEDLHGETMERFGYSLRHHARKAARAVALEPVRATR